MSPDVRFTPSPDDEGTKTGVRIVPVDPGEVQTIKEMDLDTARVVLQAIVDSDETTFTPETPLDSIGGYATEQIREAERIVAQSIIDTSDSEMMMQGRTRLAKKVTKQGELQLFLSDRSVRLKLMSDEPYVIDNDFPLQEPTEGIHNVQTRFAEFRNGIVKESLLSNVERSPGLVGFQHLIRGIRWMSANMLDWGNPNTIMPEQLDDKGLPRPPVETPRAIGKITF